MVRRKRRLRPSDLSLRQEVAAIETGTFAKIQNGLVEHGSEEHKKLLATEQAYPVRDAEIRTSEIRFQMRSRYRPPTPYTE